MKTVCYICNRLHDDFDDAARCCAEVDEVEVDEDCVCESKEDCSKGCFDLFPKFPRCKTSGMSTGEYVRAYEELNHLKKSEHLATQWGQS